jgi:signal transduction histidine kinase
MVSNDERVAAAFSERRWAVTIVLAVLAGSVMFALAAGPYPHARSSRILLAVLACAPVLLLRRWPVPVLTVAVAATVFLNGAGAAELPLGALLGAGTYFVASRMRRHTSIEITLLAAAAIGVSALIGTSGTRDVPLGLEFAYGYLPLAAGWFVGDAVAARNRYHAGLAQQAARERAAEGEKAQREIRAERVRIARELHDVVAHTLAVITVQAGVGRRLMDKWPEEGRNALESIETIGRTAEDELRVVLGLLRDETLEQDSLAPAPRLVDLKELVETVAAAGTPVTLRTSGSDRQLSPALELSLYRIVQEALTNVVKHAPGAATTVDLDVSADEVRVEVADTGDPRMSDAPRSAVPGTGHGIVGMRERIGAFGGSLVAEPFRNGFLVVARVPIDGTP